MKTRAIPSNAVRFFSGSSHPTLAGGIAKSLGVALDPVKIARFSNDNLYIQLGASVRSRSVFLVQSLVPPANEHLMELLMMIDIARAAAAKEIHAIIPYFSYARSDKKDAPRISITARLIANLLETAGATHVMTMTLHSPQVHGFFNIPIDPLTARHVFVKYFQRKKLKDTIVIAPDAGRAHSAYRFAKALGLHSVSAEKHRISDTTVEISATIGKQVQGVRCGLIYDDEIATGGSVAELCRVLIQHGLQEIIVVCTHGVFTGPALTRLAAIPQIKEIVTTDTVPLPLEKRLPNIKVLSVAATFGEAIRRNFFQESIGDLFSFG